MIQLDKLPLVLCLIAVLIIPYRDNTYMKSKIISLIIQTILVSFSMILIVFNESSNVLLVILFMWDYSLIETLSANIKLYKFGKKSDNIQEDMLDGEDEELEDYSYNCEEYDDNLYEQVNPDEHTYYYNNEKLEEKDKKDD